MVLDQLEEQYVWEEIKCWKEKDSKDYLIFCTNENLQNI